MKNNLIEKYDNKILRSLIQLIPFGIGSGVDTYLKETISNYQNERLKTFFDELGKGDILLTDELINEEDFLHQYFNTLRAVLNTRRREKIVLFARMLKSRTKIDYKDADELEYFLKILDDLTMDEINSLILLNQYEERYPIEINNINNRLSENNKFWKEYKTMVSNEMNIHENEIEGFLIRMERTGCFYYHRIIPKNYKPAGGATTERFRKLLTIVDEYRS